MFLHLDDSMTIEEVQDRFNECFPYLKIAFYSQPHNKFESSGKEFQYSEKTRIIDIRKKHNNGVMEIKSWYTTAKVEQELKELFDVNVQVFRYDMNGNWIQSTFSDELTLRQQSDIALDANASHSIDTMIGQSL